LAAIATSLDLYGLRFLDKFHYPLAYATEERAMTNEMILKLEDGLELTAEEKATLTPEQLERYEADMADEAEHLALMADDFDLDALAASLGLTL